MGGGGKGGGGQAAPYERELSDLLLGSLYESTLQRRPEMAGMFGPETRAGAAYRDIFGREPVAGAGVQLPPAYGTISRKAHEMLGHQLPPEQDRFFRGGRIQTGAPETVARAPTTVSQTPAAAPTAPPRERRWVQLPGGAKIQVPEGGWNPRISQAERTLPVGVTPPSGFEHLGSRGGQYQGAGQLVPVPGGQPMYMPPSIAPRGVPSTPAQTTTVPPTAGSPLTTSPRRARPATRGQYQGAGQYTPVPGGPRFQYTTPGAVKVPEARFRALAETGGERIGRGARQSQQELMRTFGRRGLGRSGLALRAAQQQYQRGAGEQQADLARRLAAERMGAEFGEAQRARDIGVQLQQAQAAENLGRSRLGVEEALGLGRLGISERGLAGQELTGAARQGDFMTQLLGGLAQSQMAAQAGRGGGGKGK